MTDALDQFAFSETLEAIGFPVFTNRSQGDKRNKDPIFAEFLKDIETKMLKSTKQALRSLDLGSDSRLAVSYAHVKHLGVRETFIRFHVSRSPSNKSTGCFRTGL